MVKNRLILHPVEPFDHPHYCFTPASEQGGILHMLSPVGQYESNAFVLVPYINANTAAIQPRFYRITGTVPVKWPQASEPTGLTFRAVTSRERYLQQVESIRRHIRRGDIYEVNYCMKFISADCTIDPVTTFRRLYEASQAPYASLVRLGDHFIICASPELYLRKSGDRLVTKPIKGTIRRGGDAAEDERLKVELQNNLKDRTENIMAVDVARNDLSRIAARGTVKVDTLCGVETFKTVHQLVSTVSCSMREDGSDEATRFHEIIEATFPMASMTGAPKSSAMDIIARCEDFERGSYSGAMGIISESGDIELCVIIRSIFYDASLQTAWFCAGGAITWLSDPESEYEECILKTAGMRAALNAVIE